MKMIFRINQLQPGATLVDGEPKKTYHLIASAVGPESKEVTNPEWEKFQAEEHEDDDGQPAEFLRVIDEDHAHTKQHATVPSGQLVLNLNDAAALGGIKAGDVVTIEIASAP